MPVETQSMLDDALRFMGVPERGRDEELYETARRAFCKTREHARPRGLWSRWDVSVDAPRGAVRIAERFDVVSHDLARLFARSTSCFVLAVTLGPEMDRQISLAQRLDMLSGTALDACASVWADACCDELEKEAAETLGEGEFLTTRFSPGYGDVPLAASEEILSLLDAARRIGLSMTRSHMMTPVKSVTALIGITNQEEDRSRGCAGCKLNVACPYRKRGERCDV